MANLGFLATVCVLAVLAGQVNGQCPQATECFNNLGINKTNPTYGLQAVFIQQICSKSAEVLYCYDDLLQCAFSTPAITVLPTKQQMNTALQTLCQNKTELVNGFNCLARQQAYPTEISACASQIQNIAAGLTPAQQQNLKGSYCSLMGSLFTCFTSMSSVRSCGNDFRNIIVVFEKQLLPTDCSGSPRLDSWLFLGVIAALVASSFKRL